VRLKSRVTLTRYDDGMFGPSWYGTVDGNELEPGHVTKLGARLHALRYLLGAASS
jgi:hypothetical protein